MEGLNLADAIPQRSQDEVNAQQDGDYVGDDGLLHCGVCGGTKQYRLRLGDVERVFPCLCACKVKELQEEKAQRAHREEMDRLRRLRDASMMEGAYKNARFSRYEITAANKRAHRIAQNYADRFVSELEEKNQGLIFYGSVGTGKSFTAACIVNQLLDRYVSAVMTSFVKILQDLQGGASREAEYIALLNRARLLVLDDLGAERNTDYALEKVYNVIDSRVRADKPMILTTNLTLDEMMNPPDMRYKRIYDRILEKCYPVEMNGPSLRMARAADRFEQMGGMLE